MAPQTSSVLVADVPRLTKQHALERESLCDFAGVAAGVGLGALVWIAILSLVRLPL
jgi:hypothetical protein